jgi:hypothetical protein
VRISAGRLIPGMSREEFCGNVLEKVYRTDNRSKLPSPRGRPYERRVVRPSVDLRAGAHGCDISVTRWPGTVLRAGTSDPSLTRA